MIKVGDSVEYNQDYIEWLGSMDGYFREDMSGDFDVLEVKEVKVKGRTDGSHLYIVLVNSNGRWSELLKPDLTPCVYGFMGERWLYKDIEDCSIKVLKIKGAVA